MKEPITCRLIASLPILLALCLGLLVAGCGGSSSTTPACGGSANPETLYLVEGAEGIRPIPPPRVLEFALPVTSTSTPKQVVTTMSAPVAEDSNGNFAIPNIFSVDIVKGPLTDSPSPFLTFSMPTGNAGFPAFDAAGDLFVPDKENTIYRIPAPLNPGNPSAQVITLPSSTGLGPTQALSAVVDSNNDLIVLDPGGVLFVVAPPYTGIPIQVPLNAPQQLSAIIGNQLLLIHIGGTGLVGQQVDVFDLPLSASSHPAFSISAGVTNAIALTGDQGGNLYIVDSFKNILVYTPPFSTSSSPCVTLDAAALPQTLPGFFPGFVFVGK